MGRHHPADRREPRCPQQPLAVFAGAVLALWLLAALAVNLGAKSLDLIPMAWVRRITATILLALGIYTALTALSG